MDEILWWKVESTGFEIEYLEKCVSESYFNEGKLAIELEKNISQKTKARHTIMCSSGTAALFLALKGVGVQSGDLVAVPSMSFIATANAVRLVGAVPVFIDCEPDTLNISTKDLADAIQKQNIKFVIIVHVSGRSAFNQNLMSLINNNNITVIEDAAEAFGSKDPDSGKYLGTIGKAGIYSFSPNKIITSGQGGAVVTDSDAIFKSCTALKDQGRPERGTGGADLHPMEGYNFKLADINSAVALGQWKKLEKRIDHLKEVYSFYRKSIIDCKHKKLFNFDVLNGELPLWPEIWVEERDQILTYLTQNKVNYRKIWHPINSQPYYYPGRPTPNSSKASIHVFWLPSSFNLNQDDLARVTTLLKCQKCDT